jgi:hypothetical protein
MPTTKYVVLKRSPYQLWSTIFSPSNEASQFTITGAACAGTAFTEAALCNMSCLCQLNVNQGEDQSLVAIVFALAEQTFLRPDTGRLVLQRPKNRPAFV